MIGSLRRKSQVHAGWIAPSISVPSPIFGGSENPRRTSRSRRPSTAVSTVSHSVVYPASAARSTSSFTRPRSRQVYTWNHLLPSLTAATSSIDRVPIVDSAYGTPARSRRPRDGEFALRVGDPGVAGRSQDQRHGHRVTENRRAGVEVADVTQHPRPPLESREARRVAAQRPLVLGATVDVVEHTTREPTASDHVESRRRSRIVLRRRSTGENDTFWNCTVSRNVLIMPMGPTVSQPVDDGQIDRAVDAVRFVRRTTGPIRQSTMRSPLGVMLGSACGRSTTNSVRCAGNTCSLSSNARPAWSVVTRWHRSSGAPTRHAEQRGVGLLDAMSAPIVCVAPRNSTSSSS